MARIKVTLCEASESLPFPWRCTTNVCVLEKITIRSLYPPAVE
jgi:hypothetical protein